MIDGSASAETERRADVTPGASEQPPAHELDMEAIERLEERAMGYLDTADVTLAAINSYADYLVTLHPERFAGLGMDNADLIKMADFGTLVQKESSKFAKNQHSSGVKPPKELDQFIPHYSGLGESKVVTEVPSRGYNDRRRVDRVASKAAELSPEKIELDTYVSELAAATQDIPAVRDTSVIISLSFLRLAQFFGQEVIQENLADNNNLTSTFPDLTPAMQGGYLALSFYAYHDIEAIKNTMRDLIPILPVSDVSPEEREHIIDTHVVELQLTDRRLRIIDDRHQRIGNAYKTVLDKSLEQVAATLQELDAQMPTLETLVPNQEKLETSLNVESQAITINKRIVRRIKHVVKIANSLRNQMALVAPQLRFPQVPAMEPRIANHIKQREAAEVAGTIATKRVTEQAQRQAIIGELGQMHAPYVMSRSEIRQIPGSNEVTAMMVKGEIGDEDVSAEALVKEDTFAAAGLIYRLDEQLRKQTRNRVFDRLFEAYEKEKQLIEKIDNHMPDFNLTTACDWLIDNVSALQASDSDVLCRLGDELALYGRMHRTPIGQRLERAARQLSPQTLQAIEAARIDAESLDIKAFPPGVSNLEALEEDALELATRPGKQKIPMIDWARLVSLDGLSVAYAQQGYETQLFRLLPGSLREHFPYYALVLSKDNHKVVVAENPKTGNATYVFEEFDPSLATWTEMVQLDKKAVRELGGRAMRHDPKHSLTRHFERVNDEVVLRLTST